MANETIRSGDLLPPTLSLQISDYINRKSILRKYGNIINIDNNSIKVPINNKSLYKLYWMSEAGDDVGNYINAIKTMEIHLNTMYSKVRISHDCLRDMGENIKQYFEGHIAQAMILEEDRMLLSGKDDAHQPSGLIYSDCKKIANQDIYELISSMYASIPTIDESIWIVNKSMMSHLISSVCKLNSVMNIFQYNNGGNVSSLMGLPIVVVDVELDKDTIILVNLHNAYLGIQKDDIVITEQSSLFTTDFCFSRRIGGKTINSDFIIMGEKKQD